MDVNLTDQEQLTLLDAFHQLQQEHLVLRQQVDQQQQSTPQTVHVLSNIQPKIFKGQRNENVNDFLEHYDEVALLNHWASDEKLRRLPAYLDLNAKSWYKSEIANLQSPQWTDVRAALKTKFGPSKPEYLHFQQMLDRRMKIDEGITSYYYSKLALLEKLSQTLTDDDKIMHIMNGLLPSYLERVMLDTFKTPEDLRQKLKLIEEATSAATNQVLWIGQSHDNQTHFSEVEQRKPQFDFRQASSHRWQPRFNQGRNRQFESSRQQSERSALAAVKQLSRDGAQQGRQPFRSSSPRPPRSNTCYNCGMPNHFANDCPQKSQREVIPEQDRRVRFTNNNQ